MVTFPCYHLVLNLIPWENVPTGQEGQKLQGT